MDDARAGTVGAPMERVDGKLKVTGSAKYAAEFPVAGLKHAVLVGSAIAKGKVVSIDVAGAKAMPGVVDVVTTETPGVGTLLSTELLYGGQTIAVVVAETLEAATHAAKRLGIVYDAEKPNVEFSIPPGDSPGNPRVRGDVAKGTTDAAKRIEPTYTTPTEHHNPMEPHGTIVAWNEGKATVYDSTQGVLGTSQSIAGRMGVKPADVHVMDPFVGGGFGCKGNSWPHTALCALAAKVVGAPVKLSLTRRQMFTSNGHRPPTHQKENFGADAAGKLTLLVHEGRNLAGRRDNFTESTGNVHGVVYACPNVSIAQGLVHGDIPPGTYMRAPGEASGTFGLETAMDELAYELGIDPLEFRIRNHADVDPTDGKPFSSKSLKECYAKGAQSFGWSRRTMAPGSMRRGDVLVGMGMATATYPANFMAASARATIDEGGRVLVQCCTQDLGTGTYTILTQIAAEALGVDPKLVRVEIADSTLPPAPVSGGSWSATSTGTAVKAAAEALRAKLGVEPRGYASAVRKLGTKTVSAEARGARDPEARNYSFHGFGAQFCEVHIDPDLRSIRVARWTGAFAVGRILNAKTLTSQFHGGIVWGIGMGLLEESVMDPHFGRYVNSNLGEYHVPVNRDVPDLDVILIPEEDKFVSPLGAKGSGEIGITGAAAAIGNAVFHATGRRVRDLPITLDKIL